MMTAISQKVKTLLQQNQLSESELARRINIPRPTLNRLVAGKMASPKMHVLEAIARYFACDVSELVNEASNTKQQTCFIPWGMLASHPNCAPLPIETSHRIPNGSFITQCLPENNPINQQALWLVIAPKVKPRHHQWVLIYSHKQQRPIWSTVDIQPQQINFMPVGTTHSPVAVNTIQWIGLIQSIHTAL